MKRVIIGLLLTALVGCGQAGVSSRGGGYASGGAVSSSGGRGGGPYRTPVVSGHSGSTMMGTTGASGSPTSFSH